MNKIFNSKQFIILCNVDDLKMSHVDSGIASSILADIDAEYRNIEKMIITQGEMHKYLGMTIDYSLPVKVIFYMVNYMGKMLEEIP